MAWTEILGQPLAHELLVTSLRQGRLAPAYLFVGPEGVGKRLVAMEMAKTINCERVASRNTEREACGQCGNCQRIQRQVHPDVPTLSPQGAAGMIGIEETRQLLGRIALRPYLGRSHVVIIDGADRLTEEAGNSVLKVLEEPPAHTMFFLLTAHPTQCLPTVRSRCCVVPFQRLSAEVIQGLLRQHHGYEAEVAEAASRLAQGSLSRAIAFASRWEAYRAITSHLGSAGTTQWLEWSVPTDRQELFQWLSSSVMWLRDVAVASIADESLVHHLDSLTAIRRQAQAWDRQRCVDAAWRLMELWESLEQFVNPRLVGTLLREQWLALLSGSSFVVQSSLSAEHRTPNTEH